MGRGCAVFLKVFKVYKGLLLSSLNDPERRWIQQFEPGCLIPALIQTCKYGKTSLFP